MMKKNTKEQNQKDVKQLKRGRPPRIVEGIDASPKMVAKAIMKCPPLQNTTGKPKS